VTEAICPLSTAVRNCVKFTTLALVWNLVEKFQTRTAMTAMTIQNTKLRSVEFKTTLQPAVSGETLNKINTSPTIPGLGFVEPIE
jgi:hypothetical protein